MLKNIDWEKVVASKRILFVFLTIVSFFVIFHRLDEAQLGGDDSYYSEVAKEMVRTHDYMTPKYRYVMDLHTSKPPMLFWMNALSGKIFSFNNFAMRLPSAVLSFLGVISLMFFITRYLDLYTAFISGLILTFTQQYLYHARSAVTDGPFSVFFALTIISFWIARSENKCLFYYLMGFFAGLAVMTRQIPGLFVYPVIFSYILFSKEYRVLKDFNFYGGIILSLVVFMPWHILMYMKYGNVFLTQYFDVTLMTAFKGYPVEYSGNPALNPWYAYFQILLNNYWPWLPFLGIGIYAFIKKFKLYADEHRKFMIYIFLWAFVPFLIFQVAKVKQYHYINPLYFPLAVISATVFNGFSKEAKIRTTKYLMIFVTLLCTVYFIFPVIPNTLDSREYKDTIKFISDVKKINTDLITLNEGWCHYDNCFMFYADKPVISNTKAEIIDKIDSKTEYFFIVDKEKFDDIVKAIRQNKINIIKSSEKSVLFNNFQNT